MGFCHIHGSFIGYNCPMCGDPWRFNVCDVHGQYLGPFCPQCNQTFENFRITWQEPKVSQRRYLPTLSELIDRLTIVQQKELKIPQNRAEYTKELEDLLHDIQLCLSEGGDVGEYGKYSADLISQLLRDVIVLTLMNCEIWHNESNFRKGIKDGNNLELTHGLNGIRNTAKNKIQERFGGRKDYKVDNVDAFKEWVPSGYEKKEEDK